MNAFADIIAAFHSAADALARDQETILTTLTQVETYKTAELELTKTIRALRTYDTELPFLENRDPIGKVAVFLPFNTPLYSLVLYGFGPLLTGNSVLVRPSSLTAHVVEPIWRILHPTISGLPIALLNERGAEFVLRVLQSDPVDALVFTGTWDSVERLRPMVSSNVRLIYSGAGLNPFVVLRDADLNLAVPSAIHSRIFNSGQDCLAAERFYVAREIIDAFVERLIGDITNLKVGPLSDRETDVGPVVSDEIVHNVRQLLSEPRGSRQVLYGSSIQGRLIPPIVLLTSNEDPIVQHEKFAPVFPIVPFETEEEMLAYVNESDFRLGVTVYGSRTGHLQFVAPHVAHNCCLLEVEDADAHIPFGGYGKSGFVVWKGQVTGGPILFSTVTSEPRNEPAQ